ARAWGWAEDATEAERLAARVRGLEKQNARNERALLRAQDAAEAWKQLAARQGHKVPCSQCGAAIVPTRVSGGVLAGWRHAQPHLTKNCPGNTSGITPKED